MAAKSLDENQDRLEKLRDQFWNLIQAGVGDDLKLNAALAPRLPNTLSVSFPGVAGHELLDRIPELCASTGSACHSESAAVSPTLAAMGISETEARGTVRLTLGWFTTSEEVERAVNLLIGAWEALGT